jgi:DNA polymerase-3 subunit beta
MKFVTTRESLLKPLQLVYGVVERRQTLPILSNLLLVMDKDQLSLTGSDKEVEITGRSTMDSGESGETTVPARKLMEICRNLPEGAKIEARLEDNRMSLSSGRFSSHLATLPATEFPSVEMESGNASVSIEANRLRNLLEQTSFAMAQQDVRYFFNGMLLEVTAERLRTVATNGQRLAMCTLDFTFDQSQEQRIIIPRKGVFELQRLIGDGDEMVQLTLSSNHLRATADSSSVITKLVDGVYPDYERAIPTGGKNVFLGDRLEIREALSRTAILSNEMYRNVRLTLSEGNLHVQANNPQQEEAEESVAVEYEGDPLEIGFNVEYLLDVLEAVSGEKVRFTLSDANGAALVEGLEDNESVYVISPMML